MNVHRMILLTIGLCFVLQTPLFSAPVHWAGNDHYYELVEDYLLWEEAKLAAESRTLGGTSGYLATITSADENAFVAILVAPATTGPWLGGYQDHDDPGYAEPAGGWKWVTGELWDYTNWYALSSEPNDGGDGEDYLQMRHEGSGQGQWNDHSAQNYSPFVVEYDVPEPATLSLLALGGLGLLRGRRRFRA